MSNKTLQNTAVLRVDNVSKIYPDGGVTALAGVSLTVARNEYIVIMGPSGSGKSTLLNILGALDTPTSGEVYYSGRAMSQIDSLTKLRSKEIGFVFQSFHLLPTFNAIENVQIPMFASDLSPSKREKRAAELLDRVGMGHRARQMPKTLSVGERQRVAIARALANDPLLLLADEPTGNLDTHNGEAVLDLFDSLRNDHNMTLVVITHSPEVALRADRVVHIRDGAIERQEYPQPTLRV